MSERRQDKMSYQKEVFNLLAEMSGTQNVVAVPRMLCKMTGSLEGGMFLSQLIYWADKGGNKEGWFYKSYPEWNEEVFLSEYQIRKMTKEFIEKGFLETTLKKANGSPTLHYRINKVALSEWILKNLSIPDTEKFQEPPCEIQGTITKTTTEITTKSIEADACNGSASPTPSPSPRKTKKVASPESTALMEAYIELIKANEPGAVINYQREREGINRLAAAGCTPDKLAAAYRTLKADRFWQAKHISSQSLGTQIGAILARVEDNQTTMELAYEW
jgi:hypothetical protein